ncbi:ribosome small subunit-dependent GTPase A [Chitinophaga sp. GCM10012297]|uniref:Small ribosomal subunit biogenesis GTPase RsgA n=1 Tax=Chitinophaga chungangae TaxID=2821488 RepID=A0ABS3YD67_9BACT|nr:ribosome small subunit-dependent GTPase A [Chitinophaga chungangae]MBO9152625.1 ribosome small subunit-dependent GTPase A [Chitinophaga chungangae]
MQATIYKSTGSWYSAKTSEGDFLQARIKGLFKIDEDITSTNPIAVGDKVTIALEEGGNGPAIITGIGNRRNYIVRSSPQGKHKKHIVASNLDQAMLVCTVKEPRTSQGFIDRFLVTAAAYHIPVILVFNKKDVYKAKEMEKFEHWKAVYEDIGYTVLLTAAGAGEGEGIGELKDLLKDKTTLISGHSGVGKSTIINRLLPHLQLKTKNVSGWSGKGLHTTTFAEMFDLPDGGQLIDTPGVREFGIVDIPKTELSHYFLEMQPYLPNCQFNNCIHMDEPGCAVKEAVEAGEIDLERYVSYASILATIEETTY